jgi:putative NADH-flavin reductase
MKLTILGATGRTGKILLAQALSAGHAVAAYTRSPAKLAPHPNLRIAQGEIADAAKMAEAIAGADAVISVIGAARGGEPLKLAPVAACLVAGMQAHGVRRLVFATGAGVRAPQDAPAGIHKLVGGLLRLMAREVLEDAVRAAQAVQSSGLDWVIVRAPMLRDGAYTGDYRVGFVRAKTGSSVSRGNFADFILKQVTGDEWLGKMPVVSDR